jgi:hypothetical protein
MVRYDYTKYGRVLNQLIDEDDECDEEDEDDEDCGKR